MPPTVEGLHKAKRSEDSHEGQNSEDMLGEFFVDFNECIAVYFCLFLFECIGTHKSLCSKLLGNRKFDLK